MRTNFEIENNYAVQLNRTHIDLHNNFDFIELSKNGNNISIAFRQTKGKWIKHNEFKKLNFEFKNISYEYYENGDTKALKADTACLGEITFFPADLREINNSIIPKCKPDKDDDLIMFFEDGRIIRIGCEEIKLTAETN